MAEISVARLSQVGGSGRLDPDYYRLEYTASARRLEEGNTARLARLAHISDGNHLKIAEQFVQLPGVRYLRGQDISIDMLLADRNEVFVPESAFLLLKRSHILRGDILVTIVGANTGLVALAFNPPERLTASCKLGILRPRGMSPLYLYAFLSSKYGQHQILRAKRGGGQTGLILSDLKNVRVSRLSDPVETGIARLVEDGHLKIARARELYSEAERRLMAAIGLAAWVPPTDIAYVANYRSTVESRRADPEFFHPKYQDMFLTLKAGIKLDTLGRLVSIRRGIEVGAEAYLDAGVPFWRVSNLTKFGFDEAGLSYISEELYSQLGAEYEPVSGDLLLSKDATPGIALYLDRPTRGIISSGILRLSLRGEIHPHYLELLLNSQFSRLQIERSAGGSVIRHWKPSDIRRTYIPRLGSDVENEIAGQVQAAHFARIDGKLALARARRAVEVTIEEGEDRGLQILN